MNPAREHNYYRSLFLLCWVSYFSTYIGRQNYSAVMAEIILREGFSNSACGLVATGFFICYGAGQIFSGFLGDRLNPKNMIFCGIFVSALVNVVMGFLHSPVAMTAVWCLNGAAQSMTWSPLLRLFSEYLPEDRQKKACVDIATTYPAAVCLTYPLCSLLIYVLSWRWVFYVSGLFMLAVSVFWMAGFSRLQKKLTELPVRLPPKSSAEATKSDRGGFFAAPFLASLLILAGSLLVIQGALRDGVTGWVPSYLTHTYQVGTFMAIFATTFLPVINLFGVYFAGLIYRKLRKNEVQTCSILFIIAFAAIACLILTEGISLILSVAFFSVITSCMMGINVMLVSFIPTYFIRWGKVSTVSGLLNSTVYIGSSLAAWGLGAIADSLGWSKLLWILCFITAAGFLLSIPAGVKWKRFLQLEKADRM